ncbi:Uncharacterised protein [Mycobacteroides abscessus subsp. abscessus]|nr:Uncharacterised protein [Mycobacteroides abscessus subsp. abscessus]
MKGVAICVLGGPPREPMVWVCRWRSILGVGQEPNLPVELSKHGSASEIYPVAAALCVIWRQGLRVTKSLSARTNAQRRRLR